MIVRVGTPGGEKKKGGAGKGMRYVSFSSGGTRGAAFVGFLDAFEDHIEASRNCPFEVWRQDVRGVAGTSAGSLAALVLALGLPREVRRELLLQLGDVRALLRHPDLTLLLHRFGCEDGATFREMVQRILERGGLSARSTLGDLRRLLRTEFVCVCTDLTTGRPRYLGSTQTPDLCVCDAIYASCCVPFVFTPHELDDGSLVVDGCLSCHLPQVFPDAETLFVNISAREARRPSNWVDFLQAIVLSASSGQTTMKEMCERYPHNYVALHVPSEAPAFDVDLTPEKMEGMIGAGYVAAVDHLYGHRVFAALTLAVTIVARHTPHSAVDLTLGEERPPVEDGP